MYMFGQNIRQSRPIWYGHVLNVGVMIGVGQKGTGDVVILKKKTGKTREDVFGCGEGGHAGGRSEGR